MNAKALNIIYNLYCNIVDFEVGLIPGDTKQESSDTKMELGFGQVVSKEGSGGACRGADLLIQKFHARCRKLLVIC